MKKLLTFLVVCLSFSMLLKADAATIVHKDMGYISVNATAAKEIIPDTASIYFSVDTSAPDSKSAANKNKEASEKLIDSLKPLLALEKSDSIQTKSFILKPNYKYEKNGKKTFINYTASNVIYVKTKNLAKVSELIDTAVANNATSVNGLEFFVENEQQFAGEIAQEALSKAKVIAGLAASNLGQKVKDIKSLRVTVYPQNSGSPYRAMAAELKASNSVKIQLPVEFGKIKLEANVNAEFYVK